MSGEGEGSLPADSPAGLPECSLSSAAAAAAPPEPPQQGAAAAALSSPAAGAAAAALAAAVRAAAAAAPPPQGPPPAAEPQIYDISLTYGELQPGAFLRVLALALPYLACAAPLAFHDFGSGEGLPPLLTAAFHAGFDACSGVEVSPRLHAAALAHAAAAPAAAAAAAAAGAPLPAGASARLQAVALHCGDGLAPGALPLLRGAALLYMNSTAFSEELLAAVFKEAERMRAGALVVCTSQVMMTPLFELCAEAVVPSTWGSATARVYRRNALPRWVVGVTGRKAKS
jgi:hypothetical protein